MRIIYGVCGEGLGHATRSRPIIEHLKKNNSVRVFAGGKAFVYLKSYFNVKKIASMHMFFLNNQVNSFFTVFMNLLRAPLYFLSFLKMLFLMLFYRPNVIVSDFEPWCVWAALIAGIPVVSIHLPAHYIPRQSLLKDGRRQGSISSVLKHNFFDMFSLWFVTQITIPFAHAVILPSFFVLPLKDKRAHYVDPIVRQEIVSCIPKKGKNILVYQTTKTNKKLIKTLLKFSEQSFVVYGFGEKKQKNNLVFKKFDNEQFIKDLALAKGVIASSGISLLTECIFLGKFMLCIPVGSQGEQIVNAYFVQKNGYGIFAKRASFDIINKFINTSAKYAAKINSVGWNSIESLKKIEKIIQDATKNN